jgi:DNA-binding response OmpR family regulator
MNQLIAVTLEPAITGTILNAPHSSMKRHRIYIAEEDTSVQSELSRALKSHGFDVTVFDSAYPIVSMMDNWPDLFIIDIELPGVNGLEVCKWLKSHDTSRNIPVIFISGDPYLKILAASAHADDYIEKPVTWRELMTKVNDCLYAEKLRIA